MQQSNFFRSDRYSFTVFVIGVSLCVFILGIHKVHAVEKQNLSFSQSIRAQYDLKEQAFENNDPLTIVEDFYTEDAVAVFPGGKTISGRKEFLEHYESVIESRLSIKSVRSHWSEDTGWDWTNTKVYPKDPEKKPLEFIMLFLWERRSDDWKCRGYIFVNGKLPKEMEL